MIGADLQPFAIEIAIGIGIERYIACRYGFDSDPDSDFDSEGLGLKNMCGNTFADGPHVGVENKGVTRFLWPICPFYGMPVY